MAYQIGLLLSLHRDCVARARGVEVLLQDLK
jgi:hypothetical protein